MYFHYAGLTDTGMLRDHNEDDYQLPQDPGDGSLITKGHLYVLADGMGGHQKGEIASAVTVKSVPTEYYAHISDLQDSDHEVGIATALSEAIAKADNAVLEATKGGGTTVVTAVLHTDLLVMMNVGDSRAYLLRDDELQLISRDHSLVSRLVEMGKISPEEALTHPRRNVLYQALGQGQGVELEIHKFIAKVQPGDTIILCSDGLWGEIGDGTIKQVLMTMTSPQTAVQKLIRLANEAGGSDNITVIIIHISDKKFLPDEETVEVEITTPTPEDTQPSSTIVGQLKPNTLPEGKYYTE